MQKALLASGAYVPEQPKYDFTAGTTASIALITPTTTYLAQLGYVLITSSLFFRIIFCGGIHLKRDLKLTLLKFSQFEIPFQ